MTSSLDLPRFGYKFACSFNTVDTSVIECYKGDCILRGKTVDKNELLEQIQFIESNYDHEEDNFVPMLCRVYGYENIYIDERMVDYTYDRDVKKIFKTIRD